MNRQDRRAAARAGRGTRLPSGSPRPGPWGVRGDAAAFDVQGGCAMGCFFHIELQKIARTGEWLVWLDDIAAHDRMDALVAPDWDQARELVMEMVGELKITGAEIPERLDPDQHSMTLHSIPRREGERN